MKLVILATTNQGKVKEIIPPLARLGIMLQSLPEDYPEIIEAGQTFAENACIKAQHVADRLNLPALADDSGICIPALGDIPGIYSARYGDDLPFLENETKDQRNIRKLLQASAHLEGEQRRAIFHCAMALVIPKKEPILVHGIWEGLITQEVRGEQGFGYDPIFFDKELNCTAAQMSKEQKMGRSHRAKALKAMLKAMPEILKK